jgi:hypothetical protein
MSREDDLDGLIESLAAAMRHARNLDDRDLIFLLKMAALASVDTIRAQPPDARGTDLPR